MNLFRKLPKIDKFIEHEAFCGLNKNVVKKLAQEHIASYREKIVKKELKDFEESELIQEVKEAAKKLLTPSLKPLINATGVVMHTNLGRSLISEEIFERVKKIACNYNNLEYNLEKGERGERYEHVSSLMRFLLGCEDVLVVNNNASAVFLILNTFCKNKEAIVSRGELVEIGGSFRVPEVMANSGAKLVEVGATNKTKLSDYENAITEETGMLMKVHKSNYAIEGFSAEVHFEEMVALAKERGVLDYFDLGSGYIKTLPYNLGKNEPSLEEVLACKPSLVSFSGDKLLGSIQAGIIVGDKKYIDALKKNQLLRMLRVDKLTLAILEESMKAYLEEAYENIPTVSMLNTSCECLQEYAKSVQRACGLKSKVIHTSTYAGGGTLPNKSMPSVALEINEPQKAHVLEARFRKVGIIGRIENDAFLLDFRSIQERDLDKLIALIKEVDCA